MKKNGRKPKKIPEVLAPDEQVRLLGVLGLYAGTPEGLRNLAIIRLFLDTGLRAGELINLKIQDIDWGTGRLKVVQGKGGKDRILWITDDDLTLLRSWLAIRPHGGAHLFTDLTGRKPLCGRWLRRMVRNVVRKAGIDKDIHVHSLRHSFATRLLQQEKNLFLVSKALGHANLSTTQIYLHLADGELEAAMKRLGNGG